MKKLFLFLIVLTFSACRKNDSNPEPEINLPDVDAPYTRDAVICKINGEYWQPSGGGGTFGGPLPIKSSFYERDSLFSITLRRIKDDPPVEGWTSFGSLGTQKGVNAINFRNSIFRDWLLQGDCIGYDLDTLQEYFIEVDTIDFTHGLVKGRFEFTAANECDDQKHFTGEFHLKPFWGR